MTQVAAPRRPLASAARRAQRPAVRRPTASSATLWLALSGCVGPCGGAPDDAGPPPAAPPSATEPRDGPLTAGSGGPPQRSPNVHVPVDARELPASLLCAGSLSISCFEPVPGGTFLMGAQATDPGAPGYDPAATPAEGPPHRVQVSPFFLHRFEVSVQYVDACLQAGACQEADFATGGTLFNRGHDERRDYPANGVTWAGARDYCAYIGARLPTEAEWELAARGLEGRRFPWGDEPGCGTVKDGIKTDWTEHMDKGPCLHDASQIHRNLRGHSPYEIEGMAGNLWEWTSDWFADDAYRGRPDPDVDPAGPSTGDRRVQRGGGWTDEDPVELRSTNRIGVPPDARLPDVGFRCAWRPPT